MSPAPSWQIVLPSGQQVAIGRSELRLGREAGSCDVLLPSGKVSRVHATLWVDDQGQAWVRDLGSANGTAVDGHRVHEHAMLRGGAVLQIADVELRVAHQEPRRPPAEEGDGAAERGYVFVRGTAPWAPLEELPSPSPTFDPQLALEALQAADREREARITATPVGDAGEGGSGIAKAMGLLSILLAAATIFFVLSSGKLEKRLAEMEPEKSDYQVLKRENQLMLPTSQLLDSGSLEPAPVAVCNRSSRPLRLLWVAAAVPVERPLPEQPVIDDFNSDNCAQSGLSVLVPPGATVSGAALGAQTACRIPPLAYHAAVEYVPEGEEASYWAATTFGKGNDCVPLTVEEQP